MVTSRSGLGRRQALQLLAAGALPLLVPSLAGCGTTMLALAPWSGPPPSETDVRMRALAYAVLAPNAHNTQPWLLALGDGTIDLYVDKTRLLPETDPPFRQAHISQGTFLETLVIALGALGQRAEVEYFPAGEYGSTVVEDRPVARVRLAPADVAVDPLFGAIAERRSNKDRYDADRPVPAAELEALARASGVAEQVRFVVDPGARARLTGICRDAMAAEVRSRARNVETARWFRFDDAEMESKRDGFGMAQAGRTGFTKWFGETFIVSRESAADPTGTFATSAVTLSQEQAASTPAFAVLASPSNTRRAQVEAGRAYTRMVLAATLRGIATHPMSQALEEYADVAEVKARLEREVGLPAGSTLQMMFRIGYARPTRHAPRRSVRAMLRST
jgi:hypothetical protein